jgi:hypothetical protein
MRTAASNAFFLAVFALFTGESVATPTSHGSPDVCAVRIWKDFAFKAELLTASSMNHQRKSLMRAHHMQISTD